jgi:aminoglycoside phosphotransferase (APT) family kinase protein
MERHEITAELAARLIATQFPQWADLPVTPVKLSGWDNTTFRLGEKFSIRMPSGAGYAAQVAKEHEWLPKLAPRLPVAIPDPVALGRPGEDYPWPWSVYRWLDGEPASIGPVADEAAFAGELVDFLTILQAIDGGDGPQAGPHSALRGRPVTSWDADTREAIDLLAGEIDAAAATEVWEAAIATEWDRAPVWLHGDVVPSNLLLAGGRLAAVIDFGCSAVGDPACDLVMAWTNFSGKSQEVFLGGVPVDAATWARGRGWALWKALITITRSRDDGGDPDADARRFG